MTLNCGYGHDFSVRDVVETVKRVSGVNFTVEIGPRRAGDPAQIVAAPDRARELLGWTPQYDDLANTVGHALAWNGDCVETRSSTANSIAMTTDVTPSFRADRQSVQFLS